MARLLFLFLILANALAYAWSHGFLGDTDHGHEPHRLEAQIQPEKLKLTATGGAISPPASATTAPLPSPASAEPEANGASGASGASGANGAKPDGLACLRVNGLSTEGASALQKAAESKFPGLTVSSREVDLPLRVDVAITGLADSAAVETKKAQIKSLGVTAPLAVESEEGGKYRLIFKHFSNKGVAYEYQANLLAKGVKSARVLDIAPARKATRLDFTGPAATLAGLPALVTGQPATFLEDCVAN